MSSLKDVPVGDANASANGRGIGNVNGNVNGNASVAASASPSPAVSLSAALQSPSPSADSLAASAPAVNAKKRVFTFQKRWLHSLPIMEKLVSDAAMDAATANANANANALARSESSTDSTPDGASAPTSTPREVIACMLCEDPGASREVFVKTWSRTNCRRGRIENHLMSKHPEFMLLLKQKRDAEGDLAVQIFLQNMREGRCNYRSEISTGLYSHMQHPVTVGSALALEQFAQVSKRPFPTDDLMAAAAASAKGPVFQQLLGNTQRETAEALEQEAKRKKTRLDDGNPTQGLDGMAGAEGGGGASQVASPFAVGAAAASTAQWRSSLVSKVIVMTGADHPIMAHAATQLWLMGANLLVTFANADTMRAFDAEHMARMQDVDESEAAAHGTIVPLWCPFHTRAQAQEWSAAIATRFAQVHALINFTTDEAMPTVTDTSDRDAPEQEAFVSNTQRLLELCQSFVGTCLDKMDHGAVINVAMQTNDTRSSMTCAALEALTKSLSADLAPTFVSVNCILCQPSVKATNGTDSESSGFYDLANLLLFLLAPESASISGSVLRLHSIPTTATTPAPPAPVPVSTSDETLPSTADSVV